MPQFRTDRHEVDGQLVATTTVDITADVVRIAMHQAIRNALIRNRTFIAATKPATAAAQASQAYDAAVAAAKQFNAVYRLLLALDGEPDLLSDETPDT